MPFFTGTAGLTSTDNIWFAWSQTSTAATTNQVWQTWTSSATAATNLFQSMDQAAQEVSDELRAQRAEAERVRIEAARKRQAERQVATERARELLLSYLTQAQREELERDGGFSVRGGSTGRRYRINAQESPGNVEVLGSDGNRIHRLCAHDRRHGTPWPDQLLAQKFYLEHHEGEFLEVANRH